MPTNYYTFQGLRVYGRAKAARSLAEKTAHMFDTHPFHEYYCCHTGLGVGKHPFWGWSSLAMFMLPELRPTNF